MKIKVTILLFLLVLLIPAMVQAETLDELIQRIASANNQELSKLTFFELNILKNAIYSSKSYKYADDRPWLYEYFYDAKSKMEPPKTSGKWDLSQYDFPEPDSGLEFWVDDTMEKAITNIRVALYKKILTFRDINEIDKALELDFQRHRMKNGQALVVMNRKIAANPELFRISIGREIHGYHCVLNIIKNPFRFDAAELLGVYVGSVVLLKNIIEAQQGKSFDGMMAWEISQLAGITPKDPQYDESKLPQAIRDKLRLLEDIIWKMTQSDIGDIPAQLKNQAVRIDLEYFEGC